ncbi:MAG: hypothetical protein GF349_03430 [Candidatus Magasanikbacteria bacterium]|nr:hypothetical protein [Candidatus Magasanikbacteria bacterium]
MGYKIYGCDLSKKVTPIMARDAVMECFKEAHNEVLEDMRDYGYKKESDQEFDKIKSLDVEMMVRQKFEDLGADFDNPEKEDIIKVCDKLAEFAKNFRQKDVIEKHYNEIMKILKKIED